MTTPTVGEHPHGFDDLVAANKRYAVSFPHGFDGIAHQGVLILTCMDSRLEPLEMFGLRVGEAKILRAAGGRLTQPALAAMVMGVHKLKVNRILIVPHTLCALPPPQRKHSCATPSPNSPALTRTASLSE